MDSENNDDTVAYTPAPHTPRLRSQNQDKVVLGFLRSPRRMAYRFVGARWWVFDDGYWLPDPSHFRVDRAIQAQAKELGFHENVEPYLVARIRNRLAGWLAQQRLAADMRDDIRPSILDD